MLKDLLKSYEDVRYEMGTGSDTWVDIKTDYEIENDALAGAVMLDHYKDLGKDRLAELKEKLDEFQKKVFNYIPKDEVEMNEKKQLLYKIDIGLNIYEEIMKS